VCLREASLSKAVCVYKGLIKNPQQNEVKMYGDYIFIAVISFVLFITLFLNPHVGSLFI
jgi:hypothetical protein